MTGQYPFRTDVSVWRKKPTIKEGQLTMASMLKSRGYHTAMVGKWHLGFDSFFGIRASTDISPYFYIRENQAVDPPKDHIEAESSEGWSPIQGSLWREGGIAPGLELKDVLPRFTQESIEVIKGHSVDDALKATLLRGASILFLTNNKRLPKICPGCSMPGICKMRVWTILDIVTLQIAASRGLMQKKMVVGNAHQPHPKPRCNT